METTIHCECKASSTLATIVAVIENGMATIIASVDEALRDNLYLSHLYVCDESNFSWCPSNRCSHRRRRSLQRRKSIPSWELAEWLRAALNQPDWRRGIRRELLADSQTVSTLLSLHQYDSFVFRLLHNALYVLMYSVNILTTIIFTTPAAAALCSRYCEYDCTVVRILTLYNCTCTYMLITYPHR